MYPTTLYHRTKEPIVTSDEEEVARLLADGWADTPAAFYASEPDPPPASKVTRRKADGDRA